MILTDTANQLLPFLLAYRKQFWETSNTFLNVATVISHLGKTCNISHYFVDLNVMLTADITFTVSDTTF